MRAGRDRLVLALPSKGRLQEQSIAFLGGCGFDVRRVGNGREYAAKLIGIDNVDIAYFRPDEIAVRVEQGDAHAGITGEDLYREYGDGPPSSFLIMPKLGFGRARLVTAVPQSWVDVATIHDLDEAAMLFRRKHGKSLRVATKFMRLTRAFFADHGIVEYSLIESLGATEGAPSAGIAELVVDLTETGTTLVENHLKEIAGGTVLQTEACLSASLRSDLWGDKPLAAFEHLIEQIEARRRATTTLVLRFAIPSGNADDLARRLIDGYGCTLTSRGTSDDHAKTQADGQELAVALCPRKKLYAVVSFVKSLGATGVIVDRGEFIFEGESAAFGEFRRVLDERGTG